MDERKKIKLENTAEQIVAIPSIVGISLVAEAISPIIGAIRTGKKLHNIKNKKGEITLQDIKKSLLFYGEHIISPVKVMAEESVKLVREGKQRLKDYDKKMEEAAENLKRVQKIAAEKEMAAEQLKREKEKQLQQRKFEIDRATTPEALSESGVDSLLTLIKNAPQVSQVRDINNKYDERFFDNGDKISSEMKDMISKKFGFGYMIGDIVISQREFNNEKVYLLNGNDVEHARVMLEIPDLQYNLVVKELQNQIKKQEKAKEQKKVKDFSDFVQKHVSSIER